MPLLCQGKHPGLFPVGQTPSQLKPQADERPFPQISQPGMHVGWNVMT